VSVDVEWLPPPAAIPAEPSKPAEVADCQHRQVVDQYSTGICVDTDTPATFLYHGACDECGISMAGFGDSATHTFDWEPLG
jgi:hypothetical protein